MRGMLAGVVVCLVGAAFGQEFPKPGPEHDRLKELAGTWDAVTKFGDQESKGVATYKPICGGMWVESDFEGDFGGQRFQGHGLDGYDLNKKKYVSVWVDSMSSAPMRLEGDFDAKAKRLVMTAESVGPDGSPQKVKNVTEYRDKDHMTFRMFMVGPNGQEQQAFTVEYTRRK